MKRKYQGLFVLKMQGQEESLDESLNAVTKELKDNGAEIEQLEKKDHIERIGRKVFAHPNHAKQKAGFFVRYHFEATPTSVNEMKAQIQLKMKELVMLQYYSCA